MFPQRLQWTQTNPCVGVAGTLFAHAVLCKRVRRSNWVAQQMAHDISKCGKQWTSRPSGARSEDNHRINREAGKNEMNRRRKGTRLWVVAKRMFKISHKIEVTRWRRTRSTTPMSFMEISGNKNKHRQKVWRQQRGDGPTRGKQADVGAEQCEPENCWMLPSSSGGGRAGAGRQRRWSWIISRRGVYKVVYWSEEMLLELVMPLVTRVVSNKGLVECLEPKGARMGRHRPRYSVLRCARGCRFSGR